MCALSGKVRGLAIRKTIDSLVDNTSNKNNSTNIDSICMADAISISGFLSGFTFLKTKKLKQDRQESTSCFGPREGSLDSCHLRNKMPRTSWLKRSLVKVFENPFITSKPCLAEFGVPGYFEQLLCIAPR